MSQTQLEPRPGSAFSWNEDWLATVVELVLIGLVGNVLLDRIVLRERLSVGFRTEFFIKTGVVLLGASINVKILVTAAAPAIVQALALITIVFGFTRWFGGVLGLDDKLRALLSSAVSICGVSARRSSGPGSRNSSSGSSRRRSSARSTCSRSTRRPVPRTLPSSTTCAPDF